MEPGKRLPGKIAIVTGGASGIGAETASTFARHGASVVLCDLQDELGLTVAGEIVAAGGVAEYRRLDVTQEDGWTQGCSVLSTEAPVGQGIEPSEGGGVSILTEGAGSVTA